ncbi:hypothetical protein [Pseudopontixanthobacter vadosimaris]|uniref:hypothetical protein n=1 Tax=Pseudopontixanthobacter vadosimaris TaxID=2726450 RepID=UPI0030B91968
MDEERIAKAHPLFQRFRLVKAVNELTVERLGDETRALTREERNQILAAFRTPASTKRSMTWGQLRKAARLPRDSGSGAKSSAAQAWLGMKSRLRWSGCTDLRGATFHAITNGLWFAGSRTRKTRAPCASSSSRRKALNPMWRMRS